MDRTDSYLLSVFLAALVHGLVITAVTVVGWPKEERVRTLIANDKLFINAVLVSENPFRARQYKEAEVHRWSAAAARQARENPGPIDQGEKVAPPMPEPRNRKAEVPPKLEAQRKDVEQAVKKELELKQQFELGEEEKLRNQWSLSLAVVDEQEYRRAVTDDEKVQAYVAQITRDIVQNWSRPPSARNGMEAVLKVLLAPTGEVLNVAVLKGSGSEAFDRSAVLAVQKAQRFIVPTDLNQFERSFREFSVLFRPDDLRQ